MLIHTFAVSVQLHPGTSHTSATPLFPASSDDAEHLTSSEQHPKNNSTTDLTREGRDKHRGTDTMSDEHHSRVSPQIGRVSHPGCSFSSGTVSWKADARERSVLRRRCRGAPGSAFSLRLHGFTGWWVLVSALPLAERSGGASKMIIWEELVGGPSWNSKEVHDLLASYVDRVFCARRRPEIDAILKLQQFRNCTKTSRVTYASCAICNLLLHVFKVCVIRQTSKRATLAPPPDDFCVRSDGYRKLYFLQFSTR